MRVLGIVPARSGSKGIPHKNLRLLAGKHLLQYTAEAAKTSKVIDRLILTTDSDAIAQIGLDTGIEVPFIRPADLAADDTPMLPVLKHAVNFIENENWKPDIVVLLQPTSPFRRAEHIVRAIELLRNEKCDSVVSVIEIPSLYSPQKAMRLRDGFLQFWEEAGHRITRRQEIESAYAREGTVYAMWRDVLMERNSIYGDKCLPLVLPNQESLSLDTMDDWDRAEKLLVSLKPQN